MDFLRPDSIFDLFPEMIVHPVSCLGLGHDLLSRQLKKTFPDYFREYTRACLRKHLKPGLPLLYEQGALFGTRYLMALPMRNHWTEKLRPDVTKEAMRAMASAARTARVATLAIPEFKGPPPGWLEKEFMRLFGDAPGNALEAVYFFKAAEAE